MFPHLCPHFKIVAMFTFFDFLKHKFIYFPMVFQSESSEMTADFFIFGETFQCTIEPRFNKLLRVRGNAFIISRVC